MFQSCQRIAVMEIHIFQLGKEAGEFFISPDMRVILTRSSSPSSSWALTLARLILFVALLLALSTSPLMLSGRAELELPLTAPAIMRRIKEIDMTRSPFNQYDLSKPGSTDK